MNRKMVIVGLVLIITAIILGAFGAHALKKQLNFQQLSSFETGVRYQMYHGIGLFILGLNATKFPFNLKVIFSFMLGGVLCFSVSIYLLSLEPILGKMTFLGPVTPIGGVLLILSWAILLFKIIKMKSE